MTIRTLALASATTSIQDHRLALGAFMGPGSSVLERRGGVQYYPGAADLVSASSLQANVTPFIAVVDGTSNALQGQIPVVVDANVTLTFSAGEAAVARTDRVVLQIRDNTYDASGSTDARVLIVKGNTSTGAANSVPASSLLLWEVVVPIGASSITFASARVDRRQWIAAPMRVPVNSQTERDALPAIPGFEVTRLDTGAVEQYWSGAWRTLLPVAAPTSMVSFARKTSDTARTSTTLADDPHLTLAVQANSVYIADFVVRYQTTTTTTDPSVGFSVPAGATGILAEWFLSTAATANVGDIQVQGWSTPNPTLLIGNAGGDVPLTTRIKSLLVTGGTAGFYTFRWAAGAGTATLFTHSFMRLEKVA